MVCLANSKVEKGRIMVGVLMENGIPVVDANGPRWLHLVLDMKRPTVPAGLIVDVLPRDVIEIEAPMVDSLEECRGTVVFDPYTLKFMGCLRDEVILAHCLGRESNANVIARLGRLLLLNVQACHILVVGRSRNGQMVELEFESQGCFHRFRIQDPWVLDAIQVDPDLLARQRSHYILVKQRTEMRVASGHGCVMTILI